MSFLDDIKVYGLIAMIVGMISVILAVVGVLGSNSSNSTVAPAIPGMMMIFVGFLAYTGKTRSKRTALTFFLIFVGIGIFLAACLGVYGGGLELIVGVVAGLVAAVIGYLLYSNKKLNNVWWIILLLVFILFAVFSLLQAFDGGFDDIEAVARAIASLLSVVLYGYMIYFLLSKEVKDRFV